MGFVIVLLSFIFIVGPLVMYAGRWAGYPLNSWQVCFFRAIGMVALIHFFWHPYPSAVSFMADIIVYSLLIFIIEKFFPSIPPPPPI